MKRIILLTLFVGLVSLNASAQTKKDKIAELLKVMQSEKMINTIFDNMTTMIQQQVSSLTDQKDAKKDSLAKVYMDFVMKETKDFAQRLMNEDMPLIYDKYFTENEIQKYINFYKTPEGKKLLDQTPAIQNELMTIMMSKYMPELTEKFKKKAEELKMK
jgi:uncharacterized protein